MPASATRWPACPRPATMSKCRTTSMIRACRWPMSSSACDCWDGSTMKPALRLVRLPGLRRNQRRYEADPSCWSAGNRSAEHRGTGQRDGAVWQGPVVAHRHPPPRDHGPLRDGLRPVDLGIGHPRSWVSGGMPSSMLRDVTAGSPVETGQLAGCWVMPFGRGHGDDGAGTIDDKVLVKIRRRRHLHREGPRVPVLEVRPAGAATSATGAGTRHRTGATSATTSDPGRRHRRRRSAKRPASSTSSTRANPIRRRWCDDALHRLGHLRAGGKLGPPRLRGRRAFPGGGRRARREVVEGARTVLRF